MSVVHRVRLPVGASPLVESGHHVEPAEVLATRRAVEGGVTVQVAARLRRAPSEAADLLQAHPGAVLDAGDQLAADGPGREVLAPMACVFLGYDADDGTALVAPLGGAQPILGHVRGEVESVTRDAIEIRVAGALVAGVGGSGNAVHGGLLMGVRDPAEELRAGAIDVGATGRIVVGGSRASAETLTRARAMGVAGIVLGGVLDKELRDFEATQRPTARDGRRGRRLRRPPGGGLRQGRHRPAALRVVPCARRPDGEPLRRRRRACTCTTPIRRRRAASCRASGSG